MTENNTNRFNQLLEKYRSNSLSAKEFQEFTWLLGKKGNEEQEILEVQARQDWQGSKPILRTIQDHQEKTRRRFQWWMWTLSSAATLALLCVAWIFWPDSVPEDVVFSTGYGETQNIELPDGSQVLLNANSSITWAGDWEERHLRTLELKGEAFFDVVQTGGIHFQVTTPNLKVDVLGTEFNVKSRGAETDVFLKSGKVNLDISGTDEKPIEMEPGDYVRYDDATRKVISTAENRIEERASWVDGMLEFQNKSVPEILAEFENLYGKTFLLENAELMDKRMDVSLPYADWDLVRKALEIALDVEFTPSVDTIIVN